MIRAIQKISRPLEWLSRIVFFGHPFRLIPTRLLLDPLLDDYNRGVLLEGRQMRRRLMWRWVLTMSACDAAAMLAVSQQIRTASKRWRFVTAGIALLFAWQQNRYFRKLPLINSQITIALDYVQANLANVKSSHNIALRTIAEYQKTGSPYVLMIRTFNEVVEARVDAKDTKDALKLMHQSGRGHTSLRAMSGEVIAEERLCAALSKWIPAIAIRNPAHVDVNRHIRPSHYKPTPRLFLPSDEWQDAIVHLIEMSPYICAHITELTPGVSMELEMIRAFGKEDSTLIVICKPTDLRPSVAKFFDHQGLVLPEYNGPDPSDPPLRFFNHLVMQDDLDYEAIASNVQVANWARGWLGS